MAREPAAERPGRRRTRVVDLEREAHGDDLVAFGRAPGSAEDPVWGPPGPAGVAAVLGDDVSLSIDLLTGHVARRSSSAPIPPMATWPCWACS